MVSDEAEIIMKTSLTQVSDTEHSKDKIFEAQISDMKYLPILQEGSQDIIELFLDGLQKQENPVTEFDEEMWYGLVEYAAVFSRDDIRFAFRDGTLML